MWKLYHNLCSSAKRENWPKSLHSRKAVYSTFFNQMKREKVWCACCTDQECWEASASHQTTSVLVVYPFTLLMAGMCCSSMAQLAAGVSNPVTPFSWLPFPWAAQKMVGWTAKSLLPRWLTGLGAFLPGFEGADGKSMLFLRVRERGNNLWLPMSWQHTEGGKRCEWVAAACCCLEVVGKVSSCAGSVDMGRCC